MSALALVFQSVSVEEHTPTNRCNLYELLIVRAFGLRNWPSSVLSSQVLACQRLGLKYIIAEWHGLAVAIIVVVVLTRVVKAIVVVN